MIMVGVNIYFQGIVYPRIGGVVNKVGIKDFGSDIKISAVIYRSEGCRVVGCSFNGNGY